MPYPEVMAESVKKVEATRERRLRETFPRLTPQEKKALLESYHPDYRSETFRPLAVGPNAGQKVPNELADLLEAFSRIDPDTFDLSRVDYETDVLIIGGGGAGTAAALTAQEAGTRVLIATKLRWGDANTIMAQGGIQAADKPNDSPVRHYLDVMGGGGFVNIPQLVWALVLDAPLVIRWLEQLGVMFDKEPDGTMITVHGGGTSRRRMHSCRDYTGMEIMRTLRDEARNRGIQALEFRPAVELLLDDAGNCVGAILYDLETEEYLVVRAKSVVLATGGMGRLHVQGFPTTNHYGATADGLVIAYRAGAEMIFMDTVQYHPTGAAFPEQILGQLVTEKVRGLGAHLVNCDGERFIYELETRDAVSAAIIRECTTVGKGVVTPTGMVGVWLDSPMIDLLRGEGTIRKALPAMVRQYERFGIDITKEPILVYPTQHYQNGGIVMKEDSSTSIPGLFVAGEVSGGVHGRNRLMGNSLLDILVFGRRAGVSAAQWAKAATLGTPTLRHVKEYHEQLIRAGINTDRISPLVLPDYTAPHTRIRRLGGVPVG
ncbi:MAG: FAD-binding protein [Armatimonadetes bacterium]|nr:FAD-binding protein [Armatimonadota bacterium]MDW8122321.1 FAD-binding protein [Armatimonadota bacterium]